MSENTKTVIGVLSGTVGTAVSSTIQDVLGIVLTAINILYLVVILGLRIYAKIKEANKDGVITKEEIDDIADTAQSGISEIKQEVDKHE